MNLSSIKSKMLIGGTLLLLIPLLVSGFLSYKESHDALLEVGMSQAEGIAGDLARLTHTTLVNEISFAATIASEHSIREVAQLVEETGSDANSEKVQTVFQDLSTQFKSMDPHYQGIFLADTKGVLYTGILESGKEYKGSDISGRDYFKLSMTSGKPVISEVVLSKSTGNMIVVVCVPIHSDDKQFLGALGGNISLLKPHISN